MGTAITLCPVPPCPRTLVRGRRGSGVNAPAGGGKTGLGVYSGSPPQLQARRRLPHHFPRHAAPCAGPPLPPRDGERPPGPPAVRDPHPWGWGPSVGRRGRASLLADSTRWHCRSALLPELLPGSRWAPGRGKPRGCWGTGTRGWRRGTGRVPRLPLAELCPCGKSGRISVSIPDDPGIGEVRARLCPTAGLGLRPVQTRVTCGPQRT